MFSSSNQLFVTHHPQKNSLNFNTTNRYNIALFRALKKEGLQGVYNRLSKFKIGEKYFLTEYDWNYLLSLDTPQTTVELSQKPIVSHHPFTHILTQNLIQNHTEIKEKNGEGVEYLTGVDFYSWERTIHHKPEMVFIPKTIVGLQNIIYWSNTHNKKIRISGFHHTSSEMFSDDNHVLISMLNIKDAVELPTKFPKMNPNNEMQGIKIIGDAYKKEGELKIRCKIGSATCNYHFQDWVHDPKGGNLQWAMPLNVILTEITFGGSNATICHGAGIKNKTISDIVKEIEFVNVRGELQTINDENLIKAAAGCFGLLGPVVSLTVELDQMTYANLNTVEKKLLALTVPPPENFHLSPQLKKELSRANVKAINDQKTQEKCLQQFINLCENSYYSEFFWFPLQEKGWVNCWNNNGNKEQAKRYPNLVEGKMQSTSAYLAYLALNFDDDKQTPLIRKIQTKIMGNLAMLTLPNKPKTVCSLEDAIHFRRGIHNIPTRMMEIEIPIPDLSTSRKPDWSVCQKAWWAVIETVYSEENLIYFPMRTTLEMRIMGGSDVIMASQNGNKRTCSIEVLTPISVNEERWKKFLQTILDKWALLKDDKGEYLNIRPHWAKRFDHLKINREKTWVASFSIEQKNHLNRYIQTEGEYISIPMRDYLKHIAYKNQINEFVETLALICKAGGYQFKDIQSRFSNSFLSELLPTQPELASIKNNFFVKHKDDLIHLGKQLKMRQFF